MRYLGKTLVLAVIALLLLSHSGRGDGVFDISRFTAHADAELPYAYLEYFPPEYSQDPAQKWPLVFFLHGSGERGDDLATVPGQPLPRDISHGKNFPFVLIAPQCPRTGKAWWEADKLHALLLRILADNQRLDPDRVYLTGLSMGGFGAWDLATAHPEMFAAVVPICGGGDPARAAALKDVPVWVFHGALDKTVLPEKSEAMVEAIKQAGGNPRYTLYPEANHYSWVPAYKDPELFAWLLAQNRRQRADTDRKN